MNILTKQPDFLPATKAKKTFTWIIILLVSIPVLSSLCIILLPASIYSVGEFIENDPLGLSNPKLNLYSLPLKTVPYDTSNCRDWESVTIEDSGNTLCVQGIVTDTIYEDSINSLHLLTGDDTELYLATQGHLLENLVGECVITTGPVWNIYDDVFMFVGLDNLFQCDDGKKIKPTVTPSNFHYDDFPDEVTFDITDCIEWDQVRLDDVGTVMCVKGDVKAKQYDEYDSTFLYFMVDACDVFYLSVPRIYLEFYGGCTIAVGEVLEYNNVPYLYTYPDHLFSCEEE